MISPPITVGQFCRANGMKLKHHNEWKKADHCPLCGVKSGFFMRPDSGAFKCLRCGAKGNSLIQLHMQLHDVSEVQARAALARMAEVQQ